MYVLVIPRTKIRKFLFSSFEARALLEKGEEGMKISLKKEGNGFFAFPDQFVICFFWDVLFL